MTPEPSAAALLAAWEREGGREGGREGEREGERTEIDMCNTSAPATTAIFSLSTHCPSLSG